MEWDERSWKNPNFRCCGCAPSRRFYVAILFYFLIMSARASHVFIVFQSFIYNFLTFMVGVCKHPFEPMLRHEANLKLVIGEWGWF